ncbi:MAG: lamin tail domain-containing protein [Deltaproteobacteria bacterium]|nr:lamin tail domain-containing protein [Deltaproteobacteria bacterium]
MNRMSFVLVAAVLLCGACGSGGGGGEDGPSGIPEGALIITEFMADNANTGSADDDWFEVYNTTDKEVCLGGLRIKAGKYSTNEFTVPAEPPRCIAAGEFYVFGAMDHEYVDYVKDAIKLPATTSVIEIRSGITVVDSVTYSQAPEDGALLGKPVDGKSFSLCGHCRDKTCKTFPSNWSVEAVEKFDDKNFGTPGAANSQCSGGGGDVIEGDGSDNLDCPPAEPGDLVISEVLADAPDENKGEWFELYALPSAAGKNLNGLEVRIGGKSKGFLLENAPGCVPLEAGKYYVVAVSAEALGSTPPFAVAAVLPSLSLTNSGSTIEIYGSGVLLDAAAYKASDSVSYQLSAAALSPVDNDSAGNWCATPKTDEYKVDGVDQATGKALTLWGTPSYGNYTCPLVCGAEQCMANGQCQALAPVGPGDVIINEVMGHPGSVAEEWVELYVAPSAQGKHMNGVELFTGGKSRGKLAPADGSCLAAPAGQYFWIARSKAGLAAQGPTLMPSAELSGMVLPDTNGTLLEFKVGGTLLDAAPYDTKTGISWQLNPKTLDAGANDLSSNWCATPTNPLQLLYTSTGGVKTYGTPGQGNQACPAACGIGQCAEGDNCVNLSPLGIGDLVFTEFLPDPGANGKEWLEIYAAPSASGKHLNGLELLVDGSSKGKFDSADCIPAIPSIYMLAAGEKEPLGAGLGQADMVFDDFALKNSKATATLRQGTLVIDEAKYAIKQTQSYQLKSGVMDAGGNDNELNWCFTPNQPVYGVGATGTYGTPRNANIACP